MSSIMFLLHKNTVFCKRKLFKYVHVINKAPQFLAISTGKRVCNSMRVGKPSGVYKSHLDRPARVLENKVSPSARADSACRDLNRSVQEVGLCTLRSALEVQ